MRQSEFDIQNQKTSALETKQSYNYPFVCFEHKANWINVKNELPSYSERVLVKLSLENIKIQIACRQSTNKYGEEWLNDAGESLSDYVTHWMPLPEIPKGR